MYVQLLYGSQNGGEFDEKNNDKKKEKTLNSSHTYNLLFVVFDIKCNFSDFSNMAVVTGIHTWDIDSTTILGFFS